MEVEEYRRMADVEHSHWWYDASRQLLEQILGEKRARADGSSTSAPARARRVRGWPNTATSWHATSCRWRSTSTGNDTTATRRHSAT